MKSLLIVIKEEYLSKGITLALMDYFQSIYTTKNPYEALEILKKDNIDTVITELDFNTIDTKEYIEKISLRMKGENDLIIIKDTPLEIIKLHSNQNIVIQQKPISIKKIINVINSIKTKEGEN